MYQTVYDVTQLGLKAYAFPAFGLIFVAIGGAIAAAPRLSERILPSGFRGGARRPFGLVFMTFGIVWTTLAFGAVHAAHQNLVSALEEGRARRVEGEVRDFHPMPAEGHALETFQVDGVKFGYSDYVEDGAFNQTASHGGPIREGLRVRIDHVDGKIARLAVAREPPTEISRGAKGAP